MKSERPNHQAILHAYPIYEARDLPTKIGYVLGDVFVAVLAVAFIWAMFVR
jgi:hypothetical protein